MKGFALRLTRDTLGGEALELGVSAFALVAAPRSTFTSLRKQLNSEHGLPTSLLKYAEEQTVASLAAVLTAIKNQGWKSQSFTNWGVVAGPRFLGREMLAKHLEKFYLQGVMGASPLLPGYLSLHAVSGTISLALKIHGPNLGVGSSRGNVLEALLTGITLQREQNLPGVWAVMSEWDPEPIPDEAGQNPEPICHAISLALVPAAGVQHNLTLRLFPQDAAQEGRVMPAPTVVGLAQYLANSCNRADVWTGALSGQSRLELTPAARIEFPALPARAA
jgi:hypothetical protein